MRARGQARWGDRLELRVDRASGGDGLHFYFNNDSDDGRHRLAGNKIKYIRDDSIFTPHNFLTTILFTSLPHSGKGLTHFQIKAY